jgi:hypothetical protein
MRRFSDLLLAQPAAAAVAPAPPPGS